MKVSFRMNFLLCNVPKYQTFSLLSVGNMSERKQNVNTTQIVLPILQFEFIITVRRELKVIQMQIPVRSLTQGKTNKTQCNKGLRLNNLIETQ